MENVLKLDRVEPVSYTHLFGAKDDGQLRQPKGWALLFHPDLLRGTQLGRNIRNYTFFSLSLIHIW